jgi:hypothetical protein
VHAFFALAIWDPIIRKYALIVPYVSITWPENGEERQKQIATIVNKLITNMLLLCWMENINILLTYKI